MLFDRSNPFCAIITKRFALTKESSTKNTYHIVLNTQDLPVSFKVGDAIGIFSQNSPQSVEAVLDLLSASKETIVVDTRTNESLTLQEFLSKKANLSRINAALFKTLLSYSPSKDAFLQIANDKDALSAFLKTHDLHDILVALAPEGIEAQEICAQLGPLLPRFYSIASSLSKHPGEIHLTVSLPSFVHNGQIRFGVASLFLCNLAEENKTQIPCFIQSTRHFTIPEDNRAPVIMVGPGTGVAPFRAFIQERIFKEAEGINWLFFGERHGKTDFFYEEEWKGLIQQGKLKLSTAFSRDQEEKVYVQHKLRESSKEIWDLLEKGAYFYVCGEADPMAKDVETTLVWIIESEGNRSHEEAKDYLKNLRHEKRYLIDVY